MTDERKTTDERRYAVISKDAVKMFAESVGYKELSDDVASLLSEDVTYRLREVIQHSCQFLRHGRRKKLTSEDVNKALKDSDSPPIHGHGTQEMLPFRQTKEGELYFVDDLDINLPNLSYSSYTAPHIPSPHVTAHWLAVEGSQRPGFLPPSLQAKTPVRPAPPVTEDMLQYYDCVTKAVLGNEEEIMKLALVDLRTNTKMAPLIPYLINFFANGVRTVNHDVCQLMKLLHLVRAIISNHSLNLEPRPYLEMLIRGVLYCITDPLAASINPMNDHWKLRDYAARLLAIISRDWETPLNNLRDDNIATLRHVLYDLSRPYCSHYGAVMGLLAFGTKAIEEVLLPHLDTYWPHMEGSMRDNSTAATLVKADAYKVHGALLLASEYLMKARVTELLASPPSEKPSENQLKPSESCTEDLNLAQGVQPATTASKVASSQGSELDIKPDPGGLMDTDPATSNSDMIGPILQLPDIVQPPKHLCQLYAQLYECFGDSLAMKCPVRHLDGIYVTRSPEGPQETLTEQEVPKSGEQLLEDILSAPDISIQENGKNQHTHDMECDNEEKSSRSSRSSRSGRSLSDENSFIEDDTDLTVKATVSDPSRGIKLTILKRPKLRTDEPVVADDGGHTLKVEDEDDIPMPILEPTAAPPKPVHSAPVHLKEVFDVVPMVQNNVFFMFRFLGCEQLCSARRNSNRMTSVEGVEPKTELKLHHDYMNMHRKRNILFRPNKKKHKIPSYFFSCNMDTAL